MRLSGQGEQGTAGGPPGDLYVVVRVTEHPFFQRDGNDLACTIPVSFTTLALGGEVVVPTLDGNDHLKVPEGTQTGATFRLRSKGMPDVSGRGRGDLLVTIEGVTPRKLNREQRAAFEQLAKVLPKETFEPREQTSDRDERNLFDRVKDIFG
jgi:molecular chaperone DnaJ